MPELEQAKEQIALSILKVAGVSGEQIQDIMHKDSKSRNAIMKRAQKALDKMGIIVDADGNLTESGKEKLENYEQIKKEDLQSAIKAESKELIAQIGRMDSYSIDKQDMRGNKELHTKYTKIANKMDVPLFDKNAKKALEYETSKDERGKGKTFLYNLYRKPMQLINRLRPTEDKPLLNPLQKALVGVVALAVLAPPFGIIAAAFMLGSAVKDGIYKGSALEEWVNKKWFKEPPEKLNSKELEQITAKGLVADIGKTAEKEKTQEKIVEKEQERTQEKDKVEAKTDVKQENVKVTKIGTDLKGKVLDSKTHPEVKTNQTSVTKEFVEIEMQDMSKKSSMDQKTKSEADKIIHKARERKSQVQEEKKGKNIEYYRKMVEDPLGGTKVKKGNVRTFP